MVCLHGIGTAVPDNVLLQHEARAIVEALFGADIPNLDRLLGVFDHAHIEQRHFMQPPAWYARERGFAESNEAFIAASVDLAEQAALKALAASGMSVADVDAVVVASTTGVATPSLDALLMLRLGVQQHAARLPIFGYGCAAGVAGLARAAELCSARTSLCTLFVAVEICSATFHRKDISKSNLVGTSLFADGAAAVILSTQRSMLHVRGSYSTLFEGTEDIMGWDVKDTGFGVRFSRDIPAFVHDNIADVMQAACSSWGITRADIGDYITHPGGAKVIAAHAEALGLDPTAFKYSSDVLRDYGNMSSATVLFVLARMLDDPAFNWKSKYALMSSLGPGFSSELLLLELA